MLFLPGILLADPLGEAVNQPTLVFTAPAGQPWAPDATDSYQDGSSARSGTIADGQQSTLQTTVTGPGTLSFRWRSSSQAGDTLSFSIDDVPQGSSLSGLTDWQLRLHSFGPGTHVLRWTYAKDAAGAAFADCAHLDAVEFSRDPALGRVMASGSAIATGLGYLAEDAQGWPVQLPGGQAKAIFAGSASLLVAPDDSLWACGPNGSAQLGLPASSSVYPQVQVATAVAHASSGSSHLHFVKLDGSLWGMGLNSSGQLGDGSTTPRTAPVSIATGVSQVYAGTSFTLFLKADGVLWGMGSNSAGQLGISGGSTPVQIATGVVQAAAGLTHTLFIKADGSLWGMGSNANGCLGDGTTTSRNAPVQIASDVASVTAGENFTLFVKTDGSLWAMGNNSAGQLGIGSTAHRYVPVRVAGDVVAVAAGQRFGLFLKADGSLHAMGENASGQLGDGTLIQRETPVPVGQGVKRIAAARSNSLFVDAAPVIATQPLAAATAVAGNGATLSVTASGPGPFSYQWYLGTRGDLSEPVAGATAATLHTPPLSANASYWVRITGPGGAADSSTARITVMSVPVITAAPRSALIPPGGNALFQVAAQGENLSYQWYRGQSGDTSSPFTGATGAMLATPPVDVSTSYWVRVSNGAGQTDSPAANLTVGNPQPLTLWGRGSSSAVLGLGIFGTGAQFYQITDNVTAMAAGRNSTHFVKADGTLWAAGANADGQLGDGSTEQRIYPVLIASDVKQVSSGYSHTLFVTRDGTLWATGSNGSGELGDGTLERRLAPVAVASGVARAVAGRYRSAFIKSDGSLWYMGVDHGEFGEGPNIRQTPVQVATGVAQIALGTYHSLFIKTDATLWGVGDNDDNQILASASAAFPMPVQMATSVAQVATTEQGSYYLRSNGEYWIAGFNVNVLTGPVLSHTGISRIFSAYANQLRVDDTGALFLRTSAGVYAPKANEISAGENHVLLLEPRPVITDQPDPVSVLAGGSATMSVQAWGQGQLAYQWYAGAKGDTSQPVSDATSATLTTSPLTSDTRFWVRVTNFDGSADSEAALATAAVQPSIPQQLDAPTGYPGAAAALRVAATGGALSYQWYAGSAGDTSQPLAGATSSLLVLPEWRAGGNFWVRVTNVAGSVDSSAVTVNAPAPIGGVLRVSGGNVYGKLGTGSTTNVSADAVVLMDNVVCVSGGFDHSLFVKSDGTLWASGRNHLGQFGNGTTTNSTVPIQIVNDVKQVATGTSFSLILKNDGTLWSSGLNNNGQLGDGSTTNRSTAVQIASGVSCMSAGPAHSLFVKSDGTLWATGQNTGGQLGTGDKTSITTPVQVASNVVAVDTGVNHTMFLKTDASLWVMGNNIDGQLGDGTTTERLLPIQTAEGVALIAAGLQCSLHVKSDGSLWSYGSNLNFRIPAAGVTPQRSTFVTEVTSIALGDYHSIFGYGANLMNTYGLNNSGQREINQHLAQNPVHFVCGPDSSFSIEPRPVITAQPASHAVVSGASTSLAVTVADTAFITYQWYRGESGDKSNPVAGANTATLSTGPITTLARFWVCVSNPYLSTNSASAEIAPGIAPLITAQPGAVHSLHDRSVALKAEASGGGLSYQWYLGTSGDTSSPVPGGTGAMLLIPFANATADYWVRVSNPAGTVDSQTARVTVADPLAGELFAVGENFSGQFGDGGTLNRIFPQGGITGVTQVSSAGPHTLVLKNDGSLYSMGANVEGQLGTGNQTPTAIPFLVAGGVSRIATSSNRSAFIKNDGTLWVMGSNSSGALGDGTSATRRTTPVQIATNVRQVALGANHIMVVKHDGTLWTAGLNSSGQLGDGGVASRSTLVQVAGGVAKAAAGSSTSLFVKVDGSLWGMGLNNANNQLGDGSATNRLLPVKIAESVVDASAYNLRSVFVLADGTLLGTRTIAQGGQLQLIASGVREIYADSHLLFLKREGALWGMGDNDLGQLGHGPGGSESLPVLVRSPVLRAAAGFRATYFIQVPAFELWARDQGLGSGADPDGDPDCDGIPNRLEQAFGLSPLQASGSGVTTSSATPVSAGIRLTLVHRRSKLQATGLSYRGSQDLESWTPLAPRLQVLDSDADGDGAVELIEASLEVPAAHSRFFLRLEPTAP